MAQQELGEKVRAQLAKRGFKSVAANGFAAPGVVVVYTPPSLRGKNMGAEFKKVGVQIAAGVPWKLGEKEGTGPKCTFRLGLFGLDKLTNVDGALNIISSLCHSCRTGNASESPISRQRNYLYIS